MIRTAEDEAANPKYAHVERERRWLVDRSRRPEIGDAPHALIEDRYINDSRLRLRRMTDSVSGAVTHKLTKKYDAADATARAIVTTDLTQGEYDLLAKLPALRIVKRRRPLDWDGNTFSLDVFEAALAPLELLEIEWPDDAGLKAIASPPWTEREISHEKDWQGGALAARKQEKEK